MIKSNRPLMDGFISGLIIFNLGSYSTSIFVPFESTYFGILVVSICVCLSVVSSVYNLKYHCVRGLLRGYLISFFSCLCFLGFFFAMDFLIGHADSSGIFPQRGLSNADGLIILLFEGIYLIGAICIRTVIFVIQLIKILKNST